MSAVPLGKREILLYEQLIGAALMYPERLFSVIVIPGGPTQIRHPGLPADAHHDRAALLGLDAAQLLLVQNYHDRIPVAFYLPSNASAELAEAKAAAGLPSPFSASQERISTLEAQIASTTARHEAIADRAGRWAYRGVLALLVLVVGGLAAWAFLFSSIVPGVLAVALVLYAVLTDAWGWTGRALAHRLGQAVKSRLLAYLEPRP